MKITIIGAAGVRTPLIVQAIIAHQDKLGLSELCLMDIDREHLELMGALTSSLEKSYDVKFRTIRTTNPESALKSADFVITTFRVGGIDSRVIDERVPLNYRILGQETTGPGGFAMGMRSIPVLLDYVNLMSKTCPNAWLINFANPAGMLTEAVIRKSGWRRAVGICDAPASMHRVIAAALSAMPEDVTIDYYGLNHLGWIKRIIYRNRDYLPNVIELIKSLGEIPGLPFDPDLIVNLGLLPNEYLYYYYYSSQAVNNILLAKESRGEQLAKLNHQLYIELQEKHHHHDLTGMQAAYRAYMNSRGETYMVTETGKSHHLSKLDPNISKSLYNEGYAGVALNLIEGLIGNKPQVQILNVPSRGAITGMDELDVVEIPAIVSHNHIQPLVVNDIPMHCMGLMQEVKQYEHLTIEAAMDKSYQKALLALTIHPLVHDYAKAGAILKDYIDKHHGYFPVLQ